MDYNAADKSQTVEVEDLNNTAHEYPAPENGDNVCRTLASKSCKSCLHIKPLSEFYFNKTRDVYFVECKLCNKIRSSKWNKKNKTRYMENCKRHKELNPELYIEYKRQEYWKHRDKYVRDGRKYRNSKHGKGVRQALGRLRELAKLNATPKWLTDEHKEQMRLMYENRPKGYHVDHIVPIKGKNVCGLHVPWNLQYLTALDNIKKSNKLCQAKEVKDKKP